MSETTLVCQQCKGPMVSGRRFCSSRCICNYMRPRRFYKRTPLAERFWSKVKKTKTCWLWTASQMSVVWSHALA